MGWVAKLYVAQPGCPRYTPDMNTALVSASQESSMQNRVEKAAALMTRAIRGWASGTKVVKRRTSPNNIALYMMCAEEHPDEVVDVCLAAASLRLAPVEGEDSDSEYPYTIFGNTAGTLAVTVTYDEAETERLSNDMVYWRILRFTLFAP